MFWCKNCLNNSNRPRITFDERVFCNACRWSEEKKKINWIKRLKILENYFKKNKSKNYNCIVPVSGGKDGSYVSYILKKKFKVRPLAITIRPPLEKKLGSSNLRHFIEKGYDHIHISPNKDVMRQLDKFGFKYKGFPYYGWLIAIHTAILQVAVKFKINLIVYGEDGEVEYGGSDESKYKPFFDVKYQKKIYLDGGYEKILKKVKAKEQDKIFFKFPSDSELNDIKITHWSFFENWDPYRNYLISKKHCGLKEHSETNHGTFTNFAQNDQDLYALHTYLMYIKFGFGRATQDAGIEIRRGAMTRNQGKNLVRLYDNQYPYDLKKFYLKYYQISSSEFDKIIDKWANKKIFKKINGIWEPKFTIK